MGKAEINPIVFKDREPILAVPRRTRTPHPDYQPGGRRDPAISGKIGGFVSLQEHQDSLRLRSFRQLDRQLARQLGYPEDEITKWFGAES